MELRLDQHSFKGDTIKFSGGQNRYANKTLSGYWIPSFHTMVIQPPRHIYFTYASPFILLTWDFFFSLRRNAKPWVPVLRTYSKTLRFFVFFPISSGGNFLDSTITCNLNRKKEEKVWKWKLFFLFFIWQGDTLHGREKEKGIRENKIYFDWSLKMIFRFG